MSSSAEGLSVGTGLEVAGIGNDEVVSGSEVVVETTAVC